MGFERWESGDVVLYRGDCLQVLPTLGKVDATITDPPYAEKTHAGARANRVGIVGGEKLITFQSLSDAQFTEVAQALLSCTRRWVVMTCDHRHAAITFDWPEFVRLGAWVKLAPMPQISGDRPGSGHESILILHKCGRKRWNGGGRSAIYQELVIKNPAIAKVPSQKPLRFVARLVADFTETGETILDPFMGSGTTGVACVQAGRKFIGIEICEDYFNVAKRRILAAQNDAPLFKGREKQLGLL